MKKTNLIKTILNKSELAGINWLNIAICPFFFISIILVSYYLIISENKVQIIICFIITFTLIVFLIIFLSNYFTLRRIKKVLLKNNEKINIHVFASYIFNKEFAQNNLNLGITNNYLIDVIVLLTSNNNIYIRPVIGYTKQPIIKITLNEIKNVETSDQIITRQNDNVQTDSVNQINKDLDSLLPINRIRVIITTDSSNYGLLVPRKEKCISLIKLISNKQIN